MRRRRTKTRAPLELVEFDRALDERRVNGLRGQEGTRLHIAQEREGFVERAALGQCVDQLRQNEQSRKKYLKKDEEERIDE